MDHQTDHHSQGRTDSGMTLIELLITMSVLGTIVAVIGAAVIVTVRQEPVTRSRLDVAAWEQSLALWLPTDLSSAGADPGDVSADEGDTPCGDAVCTFGSNALQLKWDDGTGETVVSYRYGPASDGQSFELRRVECHGGSCISLVVLRDLSMPLDDDGNPIAWSAGDPVPDTIINVTVPLAVGSSSSGSCDPLAVPPDPDCDTNTRAQRVIVNVNGAPGLDGVDRSSTVSFTAGGSSLSELEPATFSGPNFLQANSGCGGPVTLIVDESGSIGSADSDVRQGVRSFVQAFDGTPTQLQIVQMYSYSDVLGSGSDWNKFYDLSEPADVEALIGPSGTSGLVSNIQTRSHPNYYTNWEDAIFRTFYNSDGQTYEELGNPNVPTPELVVFFTDGMPTRDRLQHKSDSSSFGPPSTPSRFDHDRYRSGYSSGVFSPRGWYRASHIAAQFNDIRMIGVLVGDLDDETRVYWSGWPWTGSWWRSIPNEKFLGDLVVGGDPSQYHPSDPPGYVARTYDGSTWGDVSSADLLLTDNFGALGGGLTEIALAECGGTLTVQTRDLAGDPADASITYQVADEVVTTTRIAKAGTFDIPLNGIPSASVDLIPQSFDGTGYAPSSWNCRAGGANLTFGTDFDLITPGVPGDGISVTVSANAAVSCTLTVSP